MMKKPAVTMAMVMHRWRRSVSPTLKAMMPRDKKQMIMVPEARPLNPSMMLVALAIPATANMVNAIETGRYKSMVSMPLISIWLRV